MFVEISNINLIMNISG